MCFCFSYGDRLSFDSIWPDVMAATNASNVRWPTAVIPSIFPMIAALRINRGAAEARNWVSKTCNLGEIVGREAHPKGGFLDQPDSTMHTACASFHN